MSAQLIDGKDGLEHWSQTYDRPTGDALAIQTDIAEKVAIALSLRLGSSAELTLGGTRNPQAQDLFFKAIDEERQGNDTPDSLRRAIGLLDAAIAADPSYAKAYAQKAYFVFASDGVWGEEVMHHSPTEGLEAARRAIAIAPTFALGHLALAVYHETRLQFGAALKEYETAASLPGNSIDSLDQYLSGSCIWGALKKAMEFGTRPSSSILSIRDWPRRRYFDSFYEPFAGGRRATVFGVSQLHRAKLFLGYSQIALGQTASARKLFESFDASDWHRLDGLTLAAAKAGERREALNLLSEMQRQFPAGYYQDAQVHAQLGDADRAFNDLTSAVEKFDGGVGVMKVDPFLRPLHGDPRFGRLALRLGLD